MKQEIEIAEYLARKLSASIDNYKQPTPATIKSWAKDIDRTLRLDGRTKEQLIDTINWIHNGGGTFWIGNIKSGKKLREQFDTLTAQRAINQPKKNIRDRIAEEIGIGKVFFKFVPRGEKDETHLCIFGDYKALYDYRRNKYYDKEKSQLLWPFIDKNFDDILKNYKEGNGLWNHSSPKQSL